MNLAGLKGVFAGQKLAQRRSAKLLDEFCTVLGTQQYKMKGGVIAQPDREKRWLFTSVFRFLVAISSGTRHGSEQT